MTTIAYVFVPSQLGTPFDMTVERSDYVTSETEWREVDAALAFHAQDLLEACEDIVNAIKKHMDFGERPCVFCAHHHIHDSDCYYVVLNEVIAKACGETPS